MLTRTRILVLGRIPAVPELPSAAVLAFAFFGGDPDLYLPDGVYTFGFAVGFRTAVAAATLA